MALKLVRRGVRLHPNEVGSFNSGWVNVVSKEKRSPYLLGANDLRVTVTARNCDGVRIIDWGVDPGLYVEEKSDGRMHSLVACVTGKGWGGVVRVLNPTENTEVTIMSEPLPPPLLRRKFTALGRWLPWR